MKYVILILIFLLLIPIMGHSQTVTTQKTSAELNELGVKYSQSSSMADKKTACDYFQEAANMSAREGQPLASAMNNIASCYSSGYGRTKDMPKAWSWYMLAYEYTVDTATKENYRKSAIALADQMTSDQLSIAWQVKAVLALRYE